MRRDGQMNGKIIISDSAMDGRESRAAASVFCWRDW